MVGRKPAIDDFDNLNPALADDEGPRRLFVTVSRVAVDLQHDASLADELHDEVAPAGPGVDFEEDKLLIHARDGGGARVFAA